VHAGDRIIQLHFNNRTLAQLSAAHTSRRHMAWEVTRRTEQDLTALAGMVKSGAFPDGTQAVWAETVIYRAMARAGFQLRAAKPGLRRPFARLYILTLMAIYGPPGFIDRDPERLEHYQLGEAWMDLRDLVQRYGPEDG
jgi:peptidoglycan-N-acetylglucosamine deacetylase